MAEEEDLAKKDEEAEDPRGREVMVVVAVLWGKRREKERRMRVRERHPAVYVSEHTLSIVMP